MWKFLDDPESIPPTNNHAKRQIRHYVVYRKNSYFTQSERGNTFLEQIISLYLTWKQKELNPFHSLLFIVSLTAPLNGYRTTNGVMEVALFPVIPVLL
jgi:hypothetical protein